MARLSLKRASRRPIVALRRAGVALLAAVVLLGGPLANAGRAETVLTMGIVPQFDARILHDIWTPILEDVGKQVGVKFRIVGAPNIPAFEKALYAGTYDVAYMNPYHYVVAHRDQGYQAIVRDGARDLFGVLVVAKDGPIKTLQDLQGKTIAFPAPNALGASLLMRAELVTEHHLRFKAAYVGDHTSAYLNAALGLSAAAGGVMATLQRTTPALRARLHILYETKHVPPHPIAVSPRVPAALRSRLQQAFLTFAATPQGRKLFAQVPMKQPIATDDAAYDSVRALKLEKFVGGGQ